MLGFLELNIGFELCFPDLTFRTSANMLVKLTFRELHVANSKGQRSRVSYVSFIMIESAGEWLVTMVIMRLFVSAFNFNGIEIL